MFQLPLIGGQFIILMARRLPLEDGRESFASDAQASARILSADRDAADFPVSSSHYGSDKTVTSAFKANVSFRHTFFFILRLLDILTDSMPAKASSLAYFCGIPDSALTPVFWPAR